MKRLITTTLLLTAIISVSAEDIKTVVATTEPQMHCENCEKKIKGNLRFEKGVKKIKTDIKEQRVTITYDADKTTSADLIESFSKFGYQASEVKDEKKK